MELELSDGKSTQTTSWSAHQGCRMWILSGYLFFREAARWLWISQTKTQRTRESHGLRLLRMLNETIFRVLYFLLARPKECVSIMLSFFPLELWGLEIHFLRDNKQIKNQHHQTLPKLTIFRRWLSILGYLLFTSRCLGINLAPYTGMSRNTLFPASQQKAFSEDNWACWSYELKTFLWAKTVSTSHAMVLPSNCLNKKILGIVSSCPHVPASCCLNPSLSGLPQGGRCKIHTQIQEKPCLGFWYVPKSGCSLLVDFAKRLDWQEIDFIWGADKLEFSLTWDYTNFVERGCL